MSEQNKVFVESRLKGNQLVEQVPFQICGEVGGRFREWWRIGVHCWSDPALCFVDAVSVPFRGLVQQTVSCDKCMFPDTSTVLTFEPKMTTEGRRENYSSFPSSIRSSFVTCLRELMFILYLDQPNNGGVAYWSQIWWFGSRTDPPYHFEQQAVPMEKGLRAPNHRMCNKISEPLPKQGFHQGNFQAPQMDIRGHAEIVKSLYAIHQHDRPRGSPRLWGSMLGSRSAWNSVCTKQHCKAIFSRVVICMPMIWRSLRHTLAPTLGNFLYSSLENLCCQGKTALSK